MPTWVDEGFESGSDGAQATTSTTSAQFLTGGGGAFLTHTSSSPYQGARSLRWSPGTGTLSSAYLTWFQSPSFSITSLYVRAAFKLTSSSSTVSGASVGISGATSATSFLFPRLNVGTAAGGAITVYWLTGNATTPNIVTPFAPTVGTWYLFEAYISGVAPTFSFQGRVSSGATILEQTSFTISSTVTGGGWSLSTARAGQFGGSPGDYSYDLDAFRVQYSEPLIFQPLFGSEWGVDRIAW